MCYGDAGLLRDFNLLVTTARGREEDACSEIWYLLGEIGDEAAKVDKTGVKGLIAAKSALNPFEVIEKLRRMMKDRPSEFRYSLRIIPIDKVVRTDLEEIKRTAAEMASKIMVDETFRVTVEKRFSEIPTNEIIIAVAANIERKVDLNNPKKIFLVEVVGGLTGMSVVNSMDILSVAKERM